jgi:hypothetical protein
MSFPESWTTAAILARLRRAAGRLIYVGMTYSNSRDLLREAIDYAVALAPEHRLVCYDPQYGILC